MLDVAGGNGGSTLADAPVGLAESKRARRNHRIRPNFRLAATRFEEEAAIGDVCGSADLSLLELNGQADCQRLHGDKRLSMQNLYASSETSPAIHCAQKRGRRTTSILSKRDGARISHWFRRGIIPMQPGSACGRKLKTPGSSARSRVNNGRLQAMALAAFVVFLLAPGVARAQFPFWPQHGFWPGQYAPHRHKHSRRHTNPELARSVQPEPPPKGPLQIIISIPDQRVSLYENAALIARSSVSTGMQHHPTPVGIFSVIGKQRWHRSNIYSGAPMPYMQRITWSGIALHAGVVPGYPASHGCIRLTNDFAIRLWHLTRRGTRVIIAPGDVRPVEIADPHLFKRKLPSTSPESQLTADSGNGVGTDEGAHSSRAPDGGTKEAASIPILSPASASAVSQKIVPVSVFVSRRLSKLLVRQGFSPLFEAPVKIQKPEEPIGTHVFTAMESRNGGEDISWTVVSMPPELPRGMARSAKPRGKPAKQMIEISPPTPSPDTAGAALERIEIPQDAVERISELLTPASSLIISDNGFSHETGKDTDFIVVMH